MGAIGRTISRYFGENMTDRAAGLTYYSLLSLFPALIVVVALVGVFGQHPETTQKIIDIARELGSSRAAQTIEAPVRGVVSNKGGAGALLGVGLVGALWSASGYVAAFMRASNEIWEVPKERRFFRKLPVRLGLTVLMTVVSACAAVSLVVTGSVAEAIGRAVGLEGTAVTVWSVAKWPVLVALVAVAFALLYYGAPNVRQPPFRSLLVGALIAVVVWIAASIGFALYLSFFGSYNETYGSIGAVVVLLLWLFLSNNAVLLGALFNAERERSRQGIGLDEGLGIDLRDSKGKDVAYTRRGR
ncbi:MAG TPA: YihY/virulence factor BrkB family protein [Actinomycetota bacterium]|nr:YihY/virulence factor BrkB family protein [Actinomycetota bacterium]